MRPVNKIAALGISHNPEPFHEEPPSPAAWGRSVKQIHVTIPRHTAKKSRISELSLQEKKEAIAAVMARVTVSSEERGPYRVPNSEIAARGLIERELMHRMGLTKIRNFDKYAGFSEIWESLLFDLRKLPPK